MDIVTLECAAWKVRGIGCPGPQLLQRVRLPSECLEKRERKLCLVKWLGSQLRYCLFDFDCIHGATLRRVPADSQDERRTCRDRKSVVEGKSVSVRLDLGGRRSIKKKTKSQL